MHARSMGRRCLRHPRLGWRALTVIGLMEAVLAVHWLAVVPRFELFAKAMPGLRSALAVPALCIVTYGVLILIAVAILVRAFHLRPLTASPVRPQPWMQACHGSPTSWACCRPSGYTAPRGGRRGAPRAPVPPYAGR